MNKAGHAFRLMAVFLTGLAVALSPAACAADGGWITGFNAGGSAATIDDARIAGGLMADGSLSTSISNDDHHFGFKAFGGYEFNRYIGVEGGYFDLGRFGFAASTAPAGTLRGESRVMGANLDAVGRVPIGKKFSLFARAGVNYSDVKDSFVGTGSVTVIDPAPKKSTANYKFGFGAEYDFTRSIAARVEAERYRIDDAIGNMGDIDLFSAGVVYRFGRAEAPLIFRAIASEPTVAVIPELPPPRPPPVPSAPIRKRVLFSADSLFEFGKETLRPAGKLALDSFVAELKGAEFETITVTGYTDRIGSHAYNMRLSERRAESVKFYLVQTAGIPEGKVATRGADGEQPVTKPDDCPGQKRTAKLIDCLQPDRRVDVEVVGTELQVPTR